MTEFAIKMSTNQSLKPVTRRISIAYSNTVMLKIEQKLCVFQDIERRNKNMMTSKSVC